MRIWLQILSKSWGDKPPNWPDLCDIVLRCRMDETFWHLEDRQKRAKFLCAVCWKWGEWERRSYNLWNALSEEWLALSEYQPCVILVKWSVVPYSAFQNSHNFTVEAISYKSNAGTKWYAAEIVIDQFNSKLFIEHVACVSCHDQDSGIKRVPLSRTVTICGRSLPPSECSLYGDFRICLGKGSDYYSYWILKT